MVEIEKEKGKLFVLDTNIGTDPGHVLCIYLLLKYITRNPENELVIVSNNEIEDTIITQQRARLIALVLDCYYTDFYPPVKIFAGLPEPKKVPSTRMQDMCSDLYELIEKVANNKLKWNEILEIPPTRIEYDPLTQVPGVFDAPRKEFPNMTDLNLYIEKQVVEGWKIEYIGLGSMTNIAHIIQNCTSLNQNNFRILQVGGACNHTESNVRYNIIACGKLIDMCAKKGIPTVFLTNDVVGLPVVDECMTWIDENTHNISQNLCDLLVESNATILKLIRKHVGSHHSDFTGSAILREVLAVIYVLNHYTVMGDIIHTQKRYEEMMFDEYFLFPTVPAQIQVKKNGSWGLEIDVAAIFGQEGIMSKQPKGIWKEAVRTTDDCYRRQWWSQMLTYFKGGSNDEIPNCIQISYGALNEKDIKDLYSELENLIKDNEVEARIRAENAAAELERKRLAALEALRAARRYWSEQQVLKDTTEAIGLRIAAWMEQERERLEAEAAAEAERLRLEMLERMRLEEERRAREEAERLAELERQEKERLRIAKLKAKKLHMFDNM